MRIRDDVFIHMTDDFPFGVYEFVRKNPDGYDIYISTKQSIEQQRESFFHALRHIENGDLDRDISVADAEWNVRYGYENEH